jgi:hypothetical protein
MCVRRWSESKWDKEFKNKVKSLELCAIYAIGPSSKSPLKIGYAQDAKSRLLSIRLAHWQDTFEIHYLRWCAGKEIARRIEAGIHFNLSELGKHIRGEWFSSSIDEIDELVLRIATASGAWVKTQDQLDEICRHRSNRALEYALTMPYGSLP